ncbi:hypothetical protein Tco_1447148 [Tanacetum coccineum]
MTKYVPGPPYRPRHPQTTIPGPRGEQSPPPTDFVRDGIIPSYYVPESDPEADPEEDDDEDPEEDPVDYPRPRGMMADARMESSEDDKVDDEVDIKA